MVYTICYGLKARRDSWTAQQPTARDALALVEALQAKGNDIHFIDLPGEGQVGVDMLRVIVDEEGLSDTKPKAK